jgi:hypothetical protein
MSLVYLQFTVAPTRSTIKPAVASGLGASRREVNGLTEAAVHSEENPLEHDCNALRQVANCKVIQAFVEALKACNI